MPARWEGKAVRRARRGLRAWTELIVHVLMWAAGEALLCLLLPLIARACEALWR